MPQFNVTLNGKQYALDFEAALADCTGGETIMLEEYLDGWENFGTGTTRSAIVTVWLAKHQAGEKMSLDDIEAIKGLVFGDVLQIEEMNGGPPDEAASAATPSTPDDSATTGTGDSRSDTA